MKLSDGAKRINRQFEDHLFEAERGRVGVRPVRWSPLQRVSYRMLHHETVTILAIVARMIVTELERRARRGLPRVPARRRRRRA